MVPCDLVYDALAMAEEEVTRDHAFAIEFARGPYTTAPGLQAHPIIGDVANYDYD